MDRSAEIDALVRDTRERLERAVVRLEEKRDDFGTRGTERVRLGGKVEGVKLALSYLEEYTRVTPPEGGQHVPPGGWLPFGSLIDYHGPAECSDETGEDGLPLWERPIPPEGGQHETE